MKQERTPIDVEKIMAEIRSEIPPEEEHWDEFTESFQYMNNNYMIPSESSLGPLNIKNFFKRVVRKLTRFIITPIVSMQNQFNASTVRCVNTTRVFIENQKRTNDILKTENSQLKTLVETQKEKLQKLQDDIFALQEQLNKCNENDVKKSSSQNGEKTL